MYKIYQSLSERSKSIITTLSLIAIIITFSTYAWFINMRTVYITSFDIEIASTESILISLDGKKWDTEVQINESNYRDTYPGNTNSWGGDGLIPISSVGKIHAGSSRLLLYEKASLTATPGGYRLMASPIENLGKEEAKGYLAFDIFIKNFSGNNYIKELNVLDEEALYLTFDSEVGVSPSGASGTGIENSVRIAFTQLGRVSANETDQQIITSITCADSEDVTGICRDAVIWEPNELGHASNLIAWYNETCKRRIGHDVRDFKSYSGKCNPIKDGVYYPTYVVNAPIVASDHLDVYDGPLYNGYPRHPKLTEVKTFTDTDRDLSGINRKEIFTLAPNSITKIRVYIYIEGQDIDNYDFASLGKLIQIQFGFTKDRFSLLDFFEDGTELLDDVWKPVITLEPDIQEIIIDVGEELILPVAKAIDKVSENFDGDDVTEDISRRIQINSDVDINTPGTYYVIYEVSDWVGNYAEPVVITVIVQE